VLNEGRSAGCVETLVIVRRERFVLESKLAFFLSRLDKESELGKRAHFSPLLQTILLHPPLITTFLCVRVRVRVRVWRARVKRQGRDTNI
jgi:hypothetical protein